QAEFPGVPTSLILAGEPPYPNAKVWSLDHMMRAARYEILAMSDSDIRVTPDFLATVAAEFADPGVGLATCPYRAVPGAGFWTTIEAIGMNTQFLGGVLAARLLEGMKFALGPTIVARKSVLRQMGGFDRLKDYLAEDFVMGKLAAELGHKVVLSSYVIEHHIGSAGLRQNFGHRLRWARSTRRSRPAGYVGEMFTMPLPWLLALWLVQPGWWPGALTLALLRVLSAGACAGWILRDPLTLRRWYLLPLQDLLAFGFWFAGFFGNTIHWRGRTYFLKPDGTFELIGR
ncbi:MAG: glycosyltransferase, partial [Bryobacteraceae bacterium]